MKCTWFSRAILVSAAVSLLSLSGCQTTQSSGGLKSSRDAYAAGQYPQAMHSARAIADSPTVPLAEREAAAYMAGLSAYKMRDHERAQQYLQLAAMSRNPSLAADARATLGMVYSERGLFGLAAENLLYAAERMTGQDKANAYFYAGVAQQKMGRWPEARTTLALALNNSSDEAFRKRVTDQLRVTGYTLQLGAFSVEDNARRGAARWSDKAVSLRLGAPRIVPAADPENRRLYLVHVGQFSSWPTAISARDGLGTTAAIVVPLTQ